MNHKDKEIIASPGTKKLLTEGPAQEGAKESNTYANGSLQYYE